MARASRLNRSTLSDDDFSGSDRTFSATIRPSRVSRARYTSPIPPTPSCARISNGPMRAPGENTMARVVFGESAHYRSHAPNEAAAPIVILKRRARAQQSGDRQKPDEFFYAFLSPADARHPRPCSARRELISRAWSVAKIDDDSRGAAVSRSLRKR